MEVYLNYDDEGGAPASGDSTSMQCSQDAPCPEATDCAGTSAEVKASCWVYLVPAIKVFRSYSTPLFSFTLVGRSFCRRRRHVLGSKRNREGLGYLDVYHRRKSRDLLLRFQGAAAPPESVVTVNDAVGRGPPAAERTSRLPASACGDATVFCPSEDSMTWPYISPITSTSKYIVTEII